MPHGAEADRIGRASELLVHGIGTDLRQLFGWHRQLACQSRELQLARVEQEGHALIIARRPAGDIGHAEAPVRPKQPQHVAQRTQVAAHLLQSHHIAALIHGLAHKGCLIGMDIVEITPSRDPIGITALTAGQLMVNFIGTVAGG